jgi:hypothetical protein
MGDADRRGVSSPHTRRVQRALRPGGDGRDRRVDGRARVAQARLSTSGAVRGRGRRRGGLDARNLFYRERENDLLLFGRPLDASLWEANNPASIARDNADAIRGSGLRIYLEAGDEDELNLHDGSEFLHRVLWDLDIAHEYHLVGGAGHVGPSLPVRLLECFRWLGAALAGRSERDDGSAYTAAENAWLEWARGGFEGDEPEEAVDLTGPSARRLLRAVNQERIDAALAADPSTARRYGRLPDPR